MQYYQFERVFSQMEKEFGKIRTGQEEAHTMTLFPMEGNVLKVQRQYPASNSRRLLEAIGLVLFDIKERYTGETIDVAKFRNEDNARLEQALLMAFDPFTNEELKEAIQSQSILDLTDLKQLHHYYQEPIQCLLKIKDSLDLWTRELGSNGYFDFIENQMGYQVNGNEMNYAIAIPTEYQN